MGGILRVLSLRILFPVNYHSLVCMSGYGFLFVTVEDPGVFTAATLGRVDDERAGAQRDAREAAWDDDGFFAVEDEGTEVDVAAGELAVAVGRMAREAHHRLGDIITRLGEDTAAKIVALGCRGMG